MGIKTKIITLQFRYRMEKKNSKKIRSIFKKVRYSDEEIIQLNKVISDSDFKNFSEYVRYFTLNYSNKSSSNSIEFANDYRDFIVSINRLNNNLNQITRKINSEKFQIDVRNEVILILNKIENHLLFIRNSL